MTKLRKLIGCLASPIYRRALRLGVAAGVEHECVLRHLRVGTLVDVGANSGQFALVARHLFPSLPIISFEPLTAAASRFRSVFAGDSRVTLHEVALGEHQGQAVMHVSAKDDSSSLLPITALQENVFPGTAQKSFEHVRIARLEGIIEETALAAPSLLKIDVQGSELSVLRGTGTLVDRFAHVYVECSFFEFYAQQPLADSVVTWLQVHGFVLRGIYNLTFDRSGRAAQADFLFVRRDSSVADRGNP